MELFIPLHHACKTIEEGRIPVLLEKASEEYETYLHLNLNESQTEEYQLQICNNGGTISAADALHRARRITDDDFGTTDVEFYTKRGQEIAQSLHFGSAIEYLAAWLNEDRKQASVCHDIDAVLSLNILKKCPKWIRFDLLSLLESEAMKQIFAIRCLSEAKKEKFKIDTDLRQKITDSANNITDPLISKILSEVMQTPPKQCKALSRFNEQAQTRIKMFQALSAK